MMGPRFWLQTLPVVALAALFSVAGLALGRAVSGPAVTAFAAAGALLAYAGALTFRRSQGWMAVCVLGLSLAAGVLAAQLSALALQRGGAPAAALAMVAIVTAALLGRSLRRFLRPLYTPLWVAAWLLIALIIGSMVAGFWPNYGRLTGAAFLLLFTALLAAWFARLESDPPPMAAMDLYLLGLSLFLAAAILRNSPA